MSTKLQQGGNLSDTEKAELEKLEADKGGLENYALTITDRIFDLMRQGVYTPDKAQAEIKDIITHLAKPFSDV